ncbi:DUF3857 domain-containing protein [Pseudotenacibaculum sp. MALMAid0570]|uniref:DUF3857 domain-containing protein n=1 Tax=Pseudotenacibaculum sp. MALMAid0570 TaxID=3143938 RepID=UPI0032E02CD0
MKKKKLLFPFLFFLLVSSSLFSQESNLMASTIPAELKENANSVLRTETMNVSVLAINKMNVKVKQVITILNKIGHDQHYDTSVGYDNDRKIKKLKLTIYNASGIEIKRVSKNKFIDISAVDGGTLYSDSRVKYYDYIPISFPYTFVLEYEFESSSTGFIPKWFPVKSYNLSVENSNYRFSNNIGLKIRTKENQFKGNEIVKNISSNSVHFNLKNFKAVKYESMSVSFESIMPNLLVGLNEFSLKNIKGKANNWEEFGKWRYDYLLNGKDKVSEEIRAKIIKMVEGVESDIEKAKIIYQYVQNKTRYISVQEGIGGWKPIAANQVDKVGYGDCKGLTNYTKALLDAVNVVSHYSIVWAGSTEKSVEKDFFSMQGNHVILNIPNQGEDIWLECTSQVMPFGFLGDFTDNRDVLVVTPEGGIIKRTPAYLDEHNLQTTKATVTFDPKGNLSAELIRKSEGIQYDSSFFLEDKSKTEQIEHYKSNVWGYNNNLEVNSIKLTNDRDSIQFTEELNLVANNYASVNNDEFIFRINAFNKNSFVPKRYRNRKLPLKVTRGYKDVDEYTIKLPEGYSVVVLPNAIDVTTKFGTYKMSVEKQDDATLLYKKELLVKHGLYPKEEYDAYRKFRRKVARYDNLKIALKKNKS